MTSPRLLSVARGQEPADLVLAGGRIVNVFSGEIETADVAIAGDRIAGVGAGYDGKQRVDLKGAFVLPGLIDAHVHIESSLCLPGEFARAVVPRGTTTAVADPHEIANVTGAAGVRYMAAASRGIPLRVVLMAPSCVPATPLATSGESLGPDELRQLLADGVVHGLAEVMNYPGVIGGDTKVAEKLAAFVGRPIDGHCPGVTGKPLNAYVASGIGSDHECVSVAEAKEKLSRGLYVLVREATNARNLHALLPLINPANGRRFCLCTDDRQPADLLGPGGIDHMLRESIAFGLDPITAIRLATLNTAEWFGLNDRGAIAPGRLADLVIADDLSHLTARHVYVGGTLAAENGATVVPLPKPIPFTSAPATVRWDDVDLRIPARGSRIRVIGAADGQLLTEHRVLTATVCDGLIVADASRDLLKIAVVERHRGTGNVGLGFIQGIGLRRGAIAGTVAHDHHNLVVIGADDESMTTAARAAASDGGGLAVAEGQRILAELPLPIAGLMSDRPVETVRDGYDQLLAATRSLGCAMSDAFMAMSFMALEVIPSLKLTDQGLVDVESFSKVELFL